MSTVKERLDIAKYLITKTYYHSYYMIESDNYITKTIALDLNKNIIDNCSDYLYLVKNFITLDLNNIKNKIDSLNIEYIDKNIIPIIPSFRTGYHAYSYFYNIIYSYINDNHKEYILLYEDTFIGIINLIDYLCNINIIDKNKILFIKKDICYKFKSITIIPNKLHGILEDIEWVLKIKNFISTYILIENPIIVYDRIAIIKDGTLSSGLGIYDKNDIYLFSQKNNLTFLDLNNFNEIEIIRIISQCNFIVFSWGSAYFKNSLYLYNNKNLKNIYVIYDNDFKHQYDYMVFYDALIKEINNIKINYLFIDNKKDIINLELIQDR